MYILVVDEDGFALDALTRELEIVFPDAEIRSEQNAQDALMWAKALLESGRQLSYAFLEIQLGIMSGVELARMLKLYHSHVNLVFCTSGKEHAYEAFSLFAKGYLLKPISARDIEQTLQEYKAVPQMSTGACRDKLRIQTFGHFEVFDGNKPVHFKLLKAKELFAYLVDRHGSSVTTEQIAAVLWENTNYDRNTKNMVTKVVSSLKASLKSAGHEDVLIKSWNQLSVDTGKLVCDAYDFEAGKAYAVRAYRGEYMSGYSWAEFTVGRYNFMEERRGGYIKID